MSGILNGKVAAEIARRLGIRFVPEERLAGHTTIGVGGPASFFFPRNVEETLALVDALREAGLEWRIVGRGSNLIVRDEPLAFAVISLDQLEKKAVFRGPELEVSANYYMPQLVRKAMEQGLAGLEELGGIPGSVGGMIRMNAGAYGVEMKDVVRSALVVSPREGARERSAAELSFAYRHSSVARDEVVLRARFLLRYDERSEIYRRIVRDRKERRASQPLNEKSAGCIFKNPVARSGELLSAGKIIDDLGLKGKGIGGAVVSEKHGNFIVNRNNAAAADVFRLIEKIKGEVVRKLGIELEEEVEIWR